MSLEENSDSSNSNHQRNLTEHTQKKSLLTRRSFLGLLGGAAAVLGGGTVGYTFFVEPFWVRTRHVEISIPGLPENWVGKTVMQLSDLHVGNIVPDDFLVRALKQTHRLKPDLIVITGDLTDSDAMGSFRENDKAIQIIEHLPRAPMGTALIMGNHDYGPNWKDVFKADDLDKKLTARGIKVLRNSMSEFDGLRIAGIDDMWSPNFDPRKVQAMDLSGAHLTLAHNPDLCDVDFWDGFKGLILSGHTHGGQCKPPFLPPPLLPVNNTRYVSGMYELSNDRKLYINPGLGFIKQVRFNARPEITMFRLSQADQ